jgi:hypothetical protein
MTVSPEQVAAAKANYEKAVAAQQAAKAIVDNLKATSADTVIAYEKAKAAYDALKPNQQLAKAKLDRANADVTIARTELQALDPKAFPSTKGAGNSVLLGHVKAYLADKPEGATNQDIYDGLVAAGVEMAGADPRANLTSYLSRWGSAGSLVDKGTGKWGVAPAAPGFLTPPAAEAPPAPPAEAPGFLAPPVAAPEAPAAPAEAPGFLAPPAEGTPAVTDALGEDFPGVEALADAGITTRSGLAGKTAADLVAIPGIGAKTAEKILAAV